MNGNDQKTRNKGLTIRRLVERAEQLGFSLDTVIKPLGTDAEYVSFQKDSKGREFVILDEKLIDYDGRAK